MASNTSGTNPMSRMQSKTDTKVNEAEVPTIEENIPVENSTAKVADATLPTPANDIKDEELIKDLDLSEFLFTGILEHTFDIVKGLKVTFKLMAGDDLSDLHKILWDMLNEPVSTTMVQLAHSKEILARAISKYGKVDLSDKPLEERKKFVGNSIPGVLIPILSRKYSIFEMSADKLFRDADLLKN